MPYLAIGLLAIYVFMLPSLVGLFVSDLLAFILSQAAVAMVQIILFTIFFYLVILPITNTLKEAQTGQLEILLAAPIKSNDVLLGEFLGVLPFYAIFVTVVAGFFTAVMFPLGIDMVQVVIIIAVFIITFLSALWIGEVAAALLRTRLGRTARGRDVGKAISFIIALPIVGLMYAVYGGGLLQALSNPGTSGAVRTVLDLLPSSWGAEVIVSFASSPGNIAAVGFETLTRFGGLVIFFLAVLWLGTRVAGHAYSLEPTVFAASKVKQDGAFYGAVRFVGGGGSFGTLLVSTFKDYGRRFENLSRIVYSIGIVILAGVFLADEPKNLLEMGQFMFPLLSVFVVGEVALRGKDNLFIYRKTPSGVGRLVRARLLHGWSVVLPIVGVFAVVSLVLAPQDTLVASLTSAVYALLVVAASIALALGVSLLNPASSEGSANASLAINLMVVIFVMSGLYIGPQIGLRSVLPNLAPSARYLYSQILAMGLSWLIGITTLYFGKRKLSRIE